MKMHSNWDNFGWNGKCRVPDLHKNAVSLFDTLIIFFRIRCLQNPEVKIWTQGWWRGGDKVWKCFFGFWFHHLVDGFILLRTGPELSKRPSNNSLIHFYKRCVSVRLGTLSQSFIQDQRRSTKHKLKNISRCHSSKLFQETRIQRLAVWKRCDLLVQFLFSNLMASDLIILCLD